MPLFVREFELSPPQVAEAAIGFIRQNHRAPSALGPLPWELDLDLRRPRGLWWSVQVPGKSLWARPGLRTRGGLEAARGARRFRAPMPEGGGRPGRGLAAP